jgi:broad specificity phosphatase PhoE
MKPFFGTVDSRPARVTILFVTHATSLDNERGIVSGWYDVDVSTLGMAQAQELGARHAQDHLHAICCADQQQRGKA